MAVKQLPSLLNVNFPCRPMWKDCFAFLLQGFDVFLNNPFVMKMKVQSDRVQVQGTSPCKGVAS